MALRTNNKCEDVLEHLREYLFQLKGTGKLLAPGERELALLLHASRGTVAKALKQLEEEKVIFRDKQGTHILTLTQKRRYAYVAVVHRNNDTFWFHPYYRLWQRLEILMRDYDIKIELYKFDPEDEKQTVESQLADISGIDTIFLSLLGNVKTTEVVARLKARGSQVILLDETNPVPETPMVALDNYAVGQLAAQRLLDAGYQRPVLISPLLHFATPTFRSRLLGFDNIIRAHGLRYELMGSNLHNRFAELALLREAINHLPERDYDCAFFITDENIDIADELIEKGLVPDKFGLLGFDGIMKARTHRPPIDCVSHGTQSQAQKIIKIIQDLEADGNYKINDCKIHPELYHGKTLKN